jgi:hypothetical protein
MTTEIEKAEATLAKLEDHRRHLIQKATELDAERQKIAFSAHTGDQKARQRLDRINAETASHQSELLSIDAAITEAQSRVEAAHRQAAIEADREQARKLVQELEAFEACGDKLDELIGDFVKYSFALERTVSEINALGCPSPSHAQLDALGARALLTALNKTPWAREFSPLPPNERRTFASLIEAWSPQIRSNIDGRLGRNNKEAA